MLKSDPSLARKRTGRPGMEHVAFEAKHFTRGRDGQTVEKPHGRETLPDFSFQSG
jgi:hypothetical protein